MKNLLCVMMFITLLKEKMMSMIYSIKHHAAIKRMVMETIICCKKNVIQYYLKKAMILNQI